MDKRLKDVIVLTGNANRPFAQAVCNHMNLTLGDALVDSFSDGETRVEVNDNVRGRRVFVVQATCPPVNNNLMELFAILDACRRASAKKITAVIPYYGYARQDRKVLPRAPISAKLVADLITTAGASRMLTVDLHAGQIQGFFNIPVDHLFAAPVLLEHLRQLKNDIVIVSPDAGGVERARAYAKRLDACLAIIDKRRESPNVSQVMNIIGDVSGMTAFLVDDMVDTGGTLVRAAYALIEKGAKNIYACCTHPVLSGKAVKIISESPIVEMIVTDTIPLREEANACPKIKVISISSLLADAIRRIYEDESVSCLFI